MGARKFLAAAFSCALVFSSLPAAVWAENDVPVDEALSYLKAKGVYKGDDDDLKSYLVDSDGRLSAFGQTLYKYLKAQPDAKDEAAGMRQILDRIRDSGEPSDEKRATIQKTLDRYAEKFKGLKAAAAGDGEDVFRLGTLREAMMTGAAVMDPDKRHFTQTPLGGDEKNGPDGYLFSDKKGKAIVENKEGAQLFNRDILNQQRQLNGIRPTGAPEIPETGSYNMEMFQNSYKRLQDRWGALDSNARVDRMKKIAELLDRQYRDDKYLDDPTLEADLNAAADVKTYKSMGATYTLTHIVDSKFKARRTYLDLARNAVELYRKEMEALRDPGRESLSRAEFESMRLHELYAQRYLQLAAVESQSYFLKDRLDRLDPDSPDYDLMMKSIDDTTMREKLAKEIREKYEGQGRVLRERGARLQKNLRYVEDLLVDADYAGSMDLVEAALVESGKEINDLNLDYGLFSAVPMYGYLAQTQLEWVSMHNLGGWAKHAFWTLRAGARHGALMDATRDMAPQFQDAQKTIADGDFARARQVIAAMHPEAAAYERSLTPDQNSGPVTNAARTMASLQESAHILNEVHETNQVVDAVGNYLTWTAGLALGAGAGSRVANFTGKVASLGDNGPWLGGWMPNPFKVLEEVSFHTRDRFNSLEPAEVNLRTQNAVAQYVERSAYRWVSASARQASFTAISGGISALFTVGMHYKDKQTALKKDFGVIRFGSHSNFDDSASGVGEAALLGFKSGAIWANQDMIPMLSYAGLPSTAFEGTAYARVGAVLGETGVVGGMSDFAQWVAKSVGKPIAKETAERWTLGAMGKAGEKAWSAGNLWKGGAIKSGAFLLSTADSIGKYVVFNEAMSAAGKASVWARDGDVFGYKLSPDASFDDIERTIKRQNRAGADLMNYKVFGVLPAWLLIPTYPAKYEAAISDYQNSIQLVEQYKNKKMDHLLANAGPETRLRMLEKPEIPWAQKIFNLRFKGEPAEITALVPHEARLEAIDKTLVDVLSGGKPSATAKDVSPLEFLRVSRMKDNTLLGDKLNMGDLARRQARAKFSESARENRDTSLKVLDAKSGDFVAGFGEVSPKARNEVAVSLFLDKEAGLKVDEKLVTRAKALIENFTDSNKLTQEPANNYLDAKEKLSTVEGAHEKFDRSTDELVGDLQAWMKAQKEKDRGSKFFGKKYTEFVKMSRDKMQVRFDKGELTADEHNVFKAWFDYLGSIEARFNSFNKAGAVIAQNRETLEYLKKKLPADKHPAAGKVAESLAMREAEWRAKPEQKDPNARVAEPDEPTDYSRMIGAMNGDLEAAKDSLRPSEYLALKEAIEDMKAAPWVLHDQHGSALPGWRPQQFETLFTSLALTSKYAKGKTPIRQFLKLTTGGGKTMLTFEGLLPLAEADAKRHGMDVAFLTVQANLEAQAQMDFIAYKKIGSKLKFETYEKLKSDIAQGKLKWDNVAERTWILGDEMDGAALQPMLTIGETTARIMMAGSVYHQIERINDQLDQLAVQDAAGQAETVRSQARRIKTALESLDPASSEGAAARRSSESLLKLADRLEAATNPYEIAAIKKEIAKLAAAQKALVEEKPLVQNVRSMAGAYRTVTDLVDLSAQIGQARADKKPVDELLKQRRQIVESAPIVLDRSVADLESAASELARADAAGQDQLARKVKTILKGQQSLLDMAGLSRSPQGKAIRSGAMSLEAKLASAAPEELAAIVKEAAAKERSILGGTTPIEAEQARAVVDAAGKLDELARAPEKESERQGGLKGWLSSGRAFVDELKKGYRQQENLLRLANGDAAAERVAALRGKAGELKAQSQRRMLAELEQAGRDLKGGAQARFNEVSRKGGAENVARSQKLIGLAQQFEAEAAALKSAKPGQRDPKKATVLLDGFAGVAKELEAAGVKAGGLRERAEAAKENLARLADNVRILERFEKGAPSLEAKRTQARAAREAAQAELRAIDPQGKALNENIFELKQKGGEAAGLEAQERQLRERVRVLEAQIESSERAFDPAREDFAESQRAFAENADAIVALADTGKPEAQGRARELMDLRRELLESATFAENPIYTVYRKIKEDMYSVARSSVRTRTMGQDAYVIETALKEAPQAAADHGASMEKIGQALEPLAQSPDAKVKAEAARSRGEVQELKGALNASPKDPEVYGNQVHAVRERLEAMDRNLRELRKTLRESEGPGGPGVAAVDAALAELSTRQTDISARDGKLRIGADQAARIWNERIDGASFTSLALKGDYPLLLAQWAKNKAVYWSKNVAHLLTGNTEPVRQARLQVDAQRFGLARTRGVELLEAIASDPLMAPSQRDSLMVDVFSSILFPHGATGGVLRPLVRYWNGLAFSAVNLIRLPPIKNPAGATKDDIERYKKSQARADWWQSKLHVGEGSSWVRTEMLNMARGYFENPANVRMDNLTGRLNVVHNGQWFESMDNPGRRWWELEYGTDLTLPYKHKTVSTINDLTQNKKVRMIGVSATGDEGIMNNFAEGGLAMSPNLQGSGAPENMRVDPQAGHTAAFASAAQSAERGAAEAKSAMVLRPNEDLLPSAVRDKLGEWGFAKKDAVVASLDDFPQARQWEHLLSLERRGDSVSVRHDDELLPQAARDQIGNRKGEVAVDLASLPEAKEWQSFLSLERGKVLNVAVMSDAPMLEAFQMFLLRTGRAKSQKNIAKISAGFEELRQQRAEAKILDQANLAALDTGEIQWLLLDGRAASRGVDLNYKGQRDDPKGFRGYTTIKQHLIAPEDISATEGRQAVGRTDIGRVLPGARREYVHTIVIRTAERDPIFQRMFASEPAFVALRADAQYKAYLAETGKKDDWAAVNDYVLKLESEARTLEYAGMMTEAAAKRAVIGDYRQAVASALAEKQAEVGNERARQAQVGTGQAAFDPNMRGLELAH